MLLTYCVARSIDDGGEVLDTPMESPMESLLVENSDIKAMDEIAEKSPEQM